MDPEHPVQPGPPPAVPTEPDPNRTTAAGGGEAPVLLDKPRTERIGTVLAWFVPVLLLGALVFAVVPVRNGRVQDCGTPLAFLAQGRTEAPLPDVDRPGQEDTPPIDFTEAEYRDAAERSCRDRITPRMVWAGALALAAFLVGLSAAIATLVGRYWLTTLPTDDPPGPVWPPPYVPQDH
jgi:hypothetical protein